MHKKAEISLRKAQEYLYTILLHLPVGVAILEGPDFRYFTINKALAEINGMSVDDHLGRPLKEVLPDAAGDIIPRLRRVRETGVTATEHEFSTRLPRNPDVARHFRDTFFPIMGPDGKPEAVGAIVVEMTALRQAERRLAVVEARRLVERLTKRQYEVFMLVADGWTSKEIADQLGITVRTVKAHRAQVMRRMGAASLAELARLAERLDGIKAYPK